LILFASARLSGLVRIAQLEAAPVTVTERECATMPLVTASLGLPALIAHLALARMNALEMANVLTGHASVTKVTWALIAR